MKHIYFLLPFILFFTIACNVSHEQKMDELSENNVFSTNREIEKLSVVASFYPLAFLAEQIGGDQVEVMNLAGSRDVHEYEPSPQDMVKISSADLIILQGGGLEPWGEDLIVDLQKKNIFTVEMIDHLELLKVEEQQEVSHNNEHDHGEFDPHTWLDPLLAQDMVDEIQKAYETITPESRDYFLSNAEKLKKRFQELDSEYTLALSSCQKNEIIVSHDAFRYVAYRYGFVTHAISGISSQDEPSAKLLAELQVEAEKGMTHILVEKNNVYLFAEMIADETGLEIFPINPLGRGTLDPQKDFFDIAEENLFSFKTALSCQ